MYSEALPFVNEDANEAATRCLLMNAVESSWFGHGPPMEDVIAGAGVTDYELIGSELSSRKRCLVPYCYVISAHDYSSHTYLATLLGTTI